MVVAIYLDISENTFIKNFNHIYNCGSILDWGILRRTNSIIVGLYQFKNQTSIDNEWLEQYKLNVFKDDDTLKNFIINKISNIDKDNTKNHIICCKYKQEYDYLIQNFECLKICIHQTDFKIDILFDVQYVFMDGHFSETSKFLIQNLKI